MGAKKAGQNLPAWLKRSGGYTAAPTDAVNLRDGGSTRSHLYQTNTADNRRPPDQWSRKMDAAPCGGLPTMPFAYPRSHNAPRNDPGRSVYRR